MKRLTTKKSVSEMNMTELAYNSCYAKDGWARYRDYEKDIDAKELARGLLKKYEDGDDGFTCDEDLMDQMADYTQYGLEEIEGLIAVFYRNVWAMADLRERLKDYEDLEEQGRLLRLPCALGDTVYRIQECQAPNCQVCRGFNRVDNCFTRYKVRIFKTHFNLYHLEKFGKTVFLTKEEAVNALKNQRSGGNKSERDSF